MPPPPPPPSRPRPPPDPPQNVKRRKKSASSAIEPTSTPTISAEPDVEVADVRQLVGDDALELLAVSFSSSPDVIATEACFGSRPVAKALGAVSLMTWTRGIGMLAAIAISWTTLNSCGASSGG